VTEPCSPAASRRSTPSAITQVQGSCPYAMRGRSPTGASGKPLAAPARPPPGGQVSHHPFLLVSSITWKVRTALLSHAALAGAALTAFQLCRVEHFLLN
jgi:hypothetical protein